MNPPGYPGSAAGVRTTTWDGQRTLHWEWQRFNNAELFDLYINDKRAGESLERPEAAGAAGNLLLGRETLKVELRPAAACFSWVRIDK